MNITVQISLMADDTMSKSAQEIAEEIIALVGGVKEKDSCSVTVTDTGNVYPPAPPFVPDPAVLSPPVPVVQEEPAAPTT